MADLFPSVLAGLGVPGEIDRLGLGLTADRVCVFLVDGLGAAALADYPEVAPFLASLLPTAESATAPSRLTACFPTTTATSIAALGVGVPPGEHGIVGYLVQVPGQDRLLNSLTWRLAGAGPKVDLRDALVPEQFQPIATVFQRAVADGIAVTQVAPAIQGGSGLTRAVLRGCTFHPNFSVGDLIDGVLTALDAGPRSLVYAYHPELDTTGHLRGPGSRAWLLELAHVDHIVAELAARLPAGAALLVTGDHGMVDLDHRIDFDTTEELHAGVGQLGGEPRARHVYTANGATADVTATWRELLGDHFEVLPRADAIAQGWFGPTVTERVAERIGDVVVAARGSAGIIRSAAEPLESALLGYHGSLTPAEVEVPLCVFRAP